MTIRKNEDWGSTVVRPEDLVICETDAATSQLATDFYLQQKPMPAIAITRSSLSRTLGKEGSNVNSQNMQATPFDLIEVTFVDASMIEQKVLALGYGLLRKSWWRGDIVAAMNTSFIGNWDCAPRSHPNDGKFDLLAVNGEMKSTQRLIASRRLKFGTHLPHPQISMKQLTSFDADCSAKPNLYVDNRRFMSVNQCKFRLLPDALTLYW
jgi:hypothetical protein